jgi:hypothetical protein
MPPLPLLFNTLVEEIGNRLKTTPDLLWVDDEPSEDDLKHILTQTAVSKFDVNSLKLSMVKELQMGIAKLICKRSSNVKILAIVYEDTQIPWDHFSSIFRAVGDPIGPMWRIVWFANRSKRIIPIEGKEPEREHINGGYTHACTSRSIVIYREEEVCRVLVHELLHAACTDKKEYTDIVDIESETEAWAELIWIGILARGRKTVAHRLWKVQAQWIIDQANILQRRNNVKDRNSYSWRYTIGRIAFLKSLGLSFPTVSSTNVNSLRLTSPDLDP